MKTRFTVDFKIFALMLKELRAIRRELRVLKGGTAAAAKPGPVRELKDKIYSDEVMKLLRITPATLIQYEKRGLIKYHKEGRNKVYSHAEILALKKMKRGKKRLGKNFTVAAEKSEA
jgi:hypothetical protein